MQRNQNTELREDWSNKVLEDICAFANANGGTVFIGCNEDGEVTGLENVNLPEDIPGQITEALGIEVSVNLLKEKELQYIEIVVPSSPALAACNGIYFYRSGSTNQILSGPSLETVLNRKQEMPWENRPLPSSTMEDIDYFALEKFKELAAAKQRMDPSLLDEPKEVLMEKLNLISNGVLTNGAILLFARNPQRWHDGAVVKVGYFKTDADLIYHDEISGPLVEIVDKTVELVYLKYMKAKIRYVGMQRQERYFVPEEAFKEALVNALVHCDYSRSVPIQISVYDDKLYVGSCGGLPAGWTERNLLESHPSIPGNPNIAQVLYLAGFMQGKGEGIRHILESCAKENLPEPEFLVNAGDIMVKFTSPLKWIVTGSQMISIGLAEKLTKKELSIYRLILEDPGYSVVKLSRSLCLSMQSVQAGIRSLKKKGIISREGAGGNEHWKILER